MRTRPKPKPGKREEKGSSGSCVLLVCPQPRHRRLCPRCSTHLVAVAPSLGSRSRKWGCQLWAFMARPNWESVTGSPKRHFRRRNVVCPRPHCQTLPTTKRCVEQRGLCPRTPEIYRFRPIACQEGPEDRFSFWTVRRDRRDEATPDAPQTCGATPYRSRRARSAHHAIGVKRQISGFGAERDPKRDVSRLGTRPSRHRSTLKPDEPREGM